MQDSQRGFTLIELMVSLALGLIIVAAAIMLFLTGQRSLALQQAAADIQDNANFALNFIAKDIRLINLNNASASMNATLANGGIVFSNQNLAGVGSSTPVTLGAISNSSNVNVGSDQLVIQYLPVQTGGYDCEGNEITDTSLYVIQRYFVRRDTIVSSKETATTALVLACDAGRATSAGGITNFGGNGQIIIKRVDYFHVLLVVESSDGNFQDMTIANYLANASTVRIVGIKLGVLTRSNHSVGVDANIQLSNPYSVLDQSVTLNSTIQNNNTRYLRQVITQTIAIRNALGAR